MKIRDNNLISFEYWDYGERNWKDGRWMGPFVIIHRGYPYIRHQAEQVSYIRMERNKQDYYYYGKMPGQSMASTMGPTFGLAGYLAGVAVDAAQNKGLQLYRLDYISQKAVLNGPVENNRRKRRP